MADFVTHIATSTVLGAGYGAVAYGWYDVPLSSSLLAAGLCSVGGMLPDLDSGSGRPLRESVAFAAAVVPMMFLERLRTFGLVSELLVLIGAGSYLLIRFGLGWLLKKFTVHRGMFHSLPAAGVFCLISFLLISGEDVSLRWYKAGGVLLGYVSHLLLDELYSLEWVRGRWHLRKSFGSAMKLWGSYRWSNLLTYGLLGGLGVVVFFEPQWMERVHQRYIETQARFWESQRARMTALEAAITQPHSHNRTEGPDSIPQAPAFAGEDNAGSTPKENEPSPASSQPTPNPSGQEPPPIQAEQGTLFRFFR